MNKHLIVLDAYEGSTEFISTETEERASAQGLGLPLDEIAAAMDCKITVLGWDDWYPFEGNEILSSIPATRPIKPPSPNDCTTRFKSTQVNRVSIPARDPESMRSFADHGLTPRSHGLINDSGLLFFASYCLNRELVSIYRSNPFDAVIVPMWGGLGYVAQMARATHMPDSIDVPFIAVVTDTSAHRQKANQEGFWNRQLIVRRQMEDVSLALADQVITFGERGNEIAVLGRLPEAPPAIRAPRFVDSELVQRIDDAAHQPRTCDGSIQFFLNEPLDSASGVLHVLDAVELLWSRGIRLEHPFISAGPDMVFAPMKPKSFIEYWSSRGFVAELGREHQWAWQSPISHLQSPFPIRLYPSLFEHLPDVWSELARGSLVLLSEAAVEGLTLGDSLPSEVLIPADCSPQDIADSLKKIMAMTIDQLDLIRREVCARVVAAQRRNERTRLGAETVDGLSQLLKNTPPPQNLERVAQLFLDRRQTLRALTSVDSIRPSLSHVDAKPSTLSVVVTCCDLGNFVRQAVESVWASERCPDQVLLIDDGSRDEPTLNTISQLAIEAHQKHLPLTVIHQRNGGLANARNAGLDAATGEFISFLDGDDLIAPSYYRLAIELLRQYPLLGGIAAWAEIFGDGIPTGFWNAPQTELPFLFAENTVIVPCLMRTQQLRQLGGYDARLRYNYEDWELAIRLLEAGLPIITIPMHLMRYRVRGNSLYRSMNDTQDQVMKEQLFACHRELVACFAVEIAAQLESRWMSLRYPDERLGANVDVQNFYSHKGSTSLLRKPVEVLSSILAGTFR